MIPARGGSKRIPRKNIRPFAGKPMIVHSIECALRSGVFDRVVVSTDDEEIGQVARAHGAETPFVRPAALSDDYAGTTEVVAHALAELQKTDALIEDVCCVYATAPFMQEEDLRRGLSLHRNGGWDYVFSATTFEFPIFRAIRITAAQGVEMVFPQHFTARSQDLPEAWHDAGQFYWGTAAAWLDRRRIFGERSAIVSIPRWRVQDIDTEDDWTRAELMSASFAER